MDMIKKVPVSEADQQKSYFKFYERELPGIAPEKRGKVFGPAMDPAKGIPFGEKANILKPEFQGDEIGFCVMPDGTGYVADINFLPGATAEMVDWYYLWRGLDQLRFTIADPANNVGGHTMQTQKALDEDLTIQERLWDSTQTVLKATPMAPKTTYLNFKYPGLCGFDMDLIGTDICKSLICICHYDDGEPPVAGPDYFICHQLVEKDGGVEVRTKIWHGWVMRYGKDYRSLADFRMQPLETKALLIQNAESWARLAPILPQLYAEEKDNF